MIKRIVLSLFAASCGLTPSALALDLIRDGKPIARLYVNPEDLKENGKPNTLAAALEDFQFHLQKMSGATLEVVETADPSAITGEALIIGSLAGKAPDTVWKEGYQIDIGKTKGSIVGETPRATSYGIYSLLQRLGCDWIMPGPLGEIIPEESTVTIEPVKVDEAPAFGQRRIWLSGGPKMVLKEERVEFDKWFRRMRLGIAESLKNDGQGHYWETLARVYKEEFEKNPEMLALVTLPDGTQVRKGPQLESTHPGLLDLLERHVRETFEKNQWPKDFTVTLPMGPADGAGYSESEESMALVRGARDPMIGGAEVTPLIVKLINDLLERIGDEFPNLTFGYLIYSVHADYPERIQPHPRIYPTLAPITYSRLHATNDPHSKSRGYYRGIVEKWAKHLKEHKGRLQVYEYNWNLADNIIPYTKVEMLANDIQYYHQLGVQGFIMESSKSWAVTGPATYVVARMMWEPEADWRKLLSEYCQKAFGAAAPDMERYFLRIAEVQKKAGQEAGSWHGAPLIFNDVYLAEAKKDLDKATAHTLTPREQKFVEATKAPDAILREFLLWHQSMGQFQFAQARKHYDRLLEIWQQTLDIDPQFACRYAPAYSRGLMTQSMDQGLTYSSAPYRIIHPIPDRLPTALDPNNIGERANFAAPEINDAHWIKTHTWGSTWDAQGLGFYRDGTVWYRVHFPLAANLKGEAVGLFLGGFEDVAAVWVNGQPIGSSGVRFLSPAIFDLTDHLKYGEENLVAIQIKTHIGHVNELFLGGILRPSFLFTGPKVKPSDSPADPQYRVLPGAAKEG